MLTGRAGMKVVGYLKAEICSAKKKMDGKRLLPADAGSELAGCRGMFGVTVLPAGLAEKQNVVLWYSPGCKPGWGVCGARSPAYSRCVLLPAAYSFVFCAIPPEIRKKIALFSLFCILHV